MLEATRLLATVLALSGCAATASYPGAWSPVVKTDDCRVVAGRYGNLASAVFPTEIEPPRLTTVFSALQRGTLWPFRPDQSEQASGMGGALPTLGNVTSVTLGVEQNKLTATFATSEPQELQLVFTNFHMGSYPVLTAAVSAPFTKPSDLSHRYICPGGLSGLITFLEQPAGVPSGTMKRPAEARISLFKASDGSLVVRWATASTSLGGYDSDVWLRYPPTAD